MNSREAFEANIKSMIDSEAGEAQALARGSDDDYATEWVRLSWWGWQAAIQHASDVAVKACEVAGAPVFHDRSSAYDDGCRDCADAIKEALK